MPQRGQRQSGMALPREVKEGGGNGRGARLMAAKVKVEEEANEKRAPLALPLRGEESESRQMNDEATRKSVSQSLADGE